MTILQRMQAMADQLADSEAKVARAVLADPTILEHYTITTLAQNAETSTSAVLRFCHSLGFSGYKDFRYALAAELRSDGTSSGMVSDPVLAAVQGMAQAVEELGALVPDPLETLAEHVAHASSVFSVGIHRSYLPAEKLRMDLEDLGIIALSARDTVEATHMANLAYEGSCLIVFSAAGALTNYRAPLDAGLASQGHSWLVTSNPRAPLAQRLEHTIVLPSVRRAGASAVDEHPVAMAFVELLGLLVRARS